MHIRRFSLGDESSLFQVYFSAIHQIAARDYTPEQVNAWAPHEVDWSVWNQRIQTIKPFVAVLDNQIVGYADLQDYGYIDHFFVSGFHPRQGIGKLLMSHLCDEAKSLGVTEMTSHVSKTAEPFFVHHGFEVIERRQSVVRGVVLPNALMRSKLG